MFYTLKIIFPKMLNSSIVMTSDVGFALMTFIFKDGVVVAEVVVDIVAVDAVTPDDVVVVTIVKCRTRRKG